MFLWLPLSDGRKGFYYSWFSPGKSLYCDGEVIFPFIQVMNSSVVRRFFTLQCNGELRKKNCLDLLSCHILLC